MSVANGLDDLWLGVICLTNADIAGSPRNMSWHSLLFKNRGGKVTEWTRGVIPLCPIKLRIPWFIQRSQYLGAKPQGARGKHPRSSNKVPKCVLSGKGGVFLKHLGGRLRSSHP